MVLQTYPANNVDLEYGTQCTKLIKYFQNLSIIMKSEKIVNNIERIVHTI